MTGNDPECWLCHFVGGAWRAPHAVQMAPVSDARGGVLGHVVLANDADLARADQWRRPATAQDARAYRAILADMAHHCPYRAPPPSIEQGAIYRAQPQDVVFAIRLASRVARAGLATGTFAVLYQT